MIDYALIECPICGKPAKIVEDVQDFSTFCSEDCPSPRCAHHDPKHTAFSWNDWAKWYNLTQRGIKWSEIRKVLYSPEELIEADRLIEIHKLYDGIQTVQEELTAQHHDAEIGCLDYKVIKALAASYELQDYLAGRIAQAESLGEE